MHFYDFFQASVRCIVSSCVTVVPNLRLRTPPVGPKINLRGLKRIYRIGKTIQQNITYICNVS